RKKEGARPPGRRARRRPDRGHPPPANTRHACSGGIGQIDRAAIHRSNPTLVARAANLYGGSAAIYRQNRTLDETGTIGRQEHDSLGNLLPRGGATSRPMPPWQVEPGARGAVARGAGSRADGPRSG